MRLLTPLVLMFLALASGCGRDQASPDAAAPAGAAETAAAGSEARSEPWDDFVTVFLDEWWRAHPIHAATAGLHQYDGLFPDWSRAGIQAEIDRLRLMRERATDFAPGALAGGQRFEREYLLAWIDRQLFWMDEAEWPFRNPEYYFDWSSDRINPDLYFTKPYAPLAERMAAYILWAENLPAAMAEIRDNLRTPMPRTWAEQGLSSFRGMAGFIAADVPGIFATVEDSALQARFREANTAAAAALSSLADWFAAQAGAGTDDYALGPELFRRALWATDRLDISLQELEALGRAELERNMQALALACDEYAPGMTLAACMGKMSADKPEGGPVEAAREQLDGLRSFLVSRELVTIPGKEPIRVAEAPPYARTNFAYINVAGPFERDMPSTYYIAPPDPAWPQAMQREYVPGKASLLFTSVHEVWPGHFLQFQHSNRSGPLGKAYVSYLFAEGWAHYSEEMMWEAGLGGGDPELRVGQLQEALLRNVRFLCAIGLHAGDMSVNECRQMFLDKGFQDPGNALQQANRGTYDPLYLNYALGKMMIRKLRADWTANTGGSWGEFHDRLLSFGGPPIPLTRKAMLGEDSGPVL